MTIPESLFIGLPGSQVDCVSAYMYPRLVFDVLHSLILISVSIGQLLGSWSVFLRYL